MFNINTMKYTLLITLLSMVVFMACEEEETVAPLSTAENELQVALYGNPEVLIEGFNHQTQQVEMVALDYNRQVFVDLDAATDDTTADTLGLHYNDTNFTHFDLWEDGADVAAGTSGWDLVFARYNGRVDDGSGTGTMTEYIVTGALINKGTTKAVKVTSESTNFVSYDALTYDDAMAMTLSSEVDAIGHDWKALDFSTFLFAIVENQYYVIESTDGVLFKLAFTGFYDDETGTKGFPKFKFERLIAE